MGVFEGGGGDMRKGGNLSGIGRREGEVGRGVGSAEVDRGGGAVRGRGGGEARGVR
jgi:hypothetical protein